MGVDKVKFDFVYILGRAQLVLFLGRTTNVRRSYIDKLSDL